MGCFAEGCSKPRYQQSRYCVTHKMRLWRYGDLKGRSRKGRAWITENGYQKIGVGKEHPLADQDGAVAVHRLLLYARIGGPHGIHVCHWCGQQIFWDHFILKGEEGQVRSWAGKITVDHLDGNKLNNEPLNLVPSCFSCNILRARWPNSPKFAKRG